jgi:hypothetical protein
MDSSHFLYIVANSSSESEWILSSLQYFLNDIKEMVVLHCTCACIYFNCCKHQITVFSLGTVYLDQSFVLIQSLKWIYGNS